MITRTKSHLPAWTNPYNSLFDSPTFCQPTWSKHELGFHPAVNISETDQAFNLELIVPGRTKEDFKIDLKEKTMTISYEVKENKEEKTDRYSRKEFTIQSFSRSFKLPETGDAENITASYQDGILKVAIPKKEIKESGIKTIAIS